MVTIAHPSGLSLTLTAQLDASALVFEYALDNGTATPVAAFNRFASVSAEGAPRVSADAAWIDLVGDTLTVLMAVAPVPAGLRVASRELPYVTPVAARERFVERVRLARPVPVRSPYRHALMQATAPAMHTVAPVKATQAARLRLDLGVFVVAPPIALREDAPGVLRPWPPGPAVSQSVLLSVELALPASLDVLDYDAVPIREPAP